ncbi:hypothetical protein AURDEDRAFT_165421 [Auricularia subglabra TFB-10046 SS5]|nr:hypothetical protein AURDEDRAFT_165421 [Auricularia subglabra TFB-10046 SS5]
MQSARFLAALSALFAFVTFAFAAPTAVQQQRDVDVQQVLGALQTQVHSILGQLDTVLQDGGLTEAVLGPIVDDLVGALDTTAADLGNLVIAVTSPVGGLPVKRQVDTAAVGQTVGAIVTDLNTILNSLVAQAATVPGVSALLIGVNQSLTQVLSLTESLVPGVLGLVTGLVGTLTTTLGQLLNGLGLGSLLGSLGL